MSHSSDTPETDARVEHINSTSFRGFIVSPNFARELERQRDALQSKLSTVHQWIERHHQDGFTDSLTYWQNLEKIGDKYGDRIDDAERQRDAAREDARRLAEAEPVAWMRRWAFDNIVPAKVRNENGRLVWPREYKFAEVTKIKYFATDVPLYAHEALTAKN